MMSWYTPERIKADLRVYERVGINALVARTDNRMIPLLLEHRAEGGCLQWFAQTCPEVAPQHLSVERAVEGGAVACHIHGGLMDHLYLNGRLNEIVPVIDLIKKAGMLAAVAGHLPGVFRWAEEHLDLDFYLCSYYNPIPRDQHPEHVHTETEYFLEDNRTEMVTLITTLSRPVIHFKVLAAGRNEPEAAFRTAAACMRPGDAMCVGFFTGDDPAQIETDARLLSEALAGAAAGA
ncbi:hypothetical protein LLH00_17250 [bacterium]|nr:hypothetical protein [bacterium]